MAKEIERRFIVVNEQWKQLAKPPADMIEQGYIKAQDRTIRVRIFTEEDSEKQKAFVTFKTKRKITAGAIDRDEWELPIEVDKAEELLKTFCHYTIKKKRHYVKTEGKTWTVDEFLAPKYHGLKLAEIELERAGEKIELPKFVTAQSEVTEDVRFSTRQLANPENDTHFLIQEIATAKASARGPAG